MLRKIEYQQLEKYYKIMTIIIIIILVIIVSNDDFSFLNESIENYLHNDDSSHNMKAAV